MTIWYRYSKLIGVPDGTANPDEAAKAALFGTFYPHFVAGEELVEYDTGEEVRSTPVGAAACVRPSSPLRRRRDRGSGMTDITPADVCGASCDRCRCGLAPHAPDVAHECDEPDPACGGSWLDHPTDPTKMLVVRWPGIREGGPNYIRAQLAEIVDPPPGEPVEEPHPGDGRPVPRGGIRFIGVLDLLADIEPTTPRKGAI